MPQFTYTARDRHGQPRSGSLPAASARELVSALRSRDWLVLSVNPATESRWMGGSPWDPRFWWPIRSLDVEVALQQMAVMLRSGVTLVNAVATAADNAGPPRMRGILIRVGQRLESGMSLSDAMAAFKIFSPLILQLTRVGEATGRLEYALSQGAAALERRRTLTTQVVTALSYPAITFLAAIGVTIFMMVSALPKLTVFLRLIGRKLPPSTERLIALSDFVQQNGVQVFTVIALVIIGLLASYLYPPLRIHFDTWILRIPVLGKVFRVGGTALFARTLGVQIRGGVTVVQSLQTIEKLSSNLRLRWIVENARGRVFQGSDLSDPLRVTPGFTPLLARMVAVGESSGNLADVLDEVARFHEGQLATLIKQITVLIEPLVILVLGVMVGYVYISFFLAIYGVAAHP